MEGAGGDEGKNNIKTRKMKESDRIEEEGEKAVCR